MKRTLALALLLLLLLQPAAQALAPAAAPLKNHPKLILADYSISPAPARASGEFVLTLRLYNTNSEYTSRNVKATLLNEAAGPESGGYGVFTPVGSSNTFYIDIIDPLETVEKELRFSVSPGAASKNHVLNLVLEYEDYEGNPYETKELIGIPVAQLARIEADEPELPEETEQHASVYLTVGFYNTGKDNLSNVLVEVEANAAAEPARYFVGNFASGSSDVFSTVIEARELGPLEGTLTIRYEDSSGTPYSLEKPFATTVVAPAAPETAGSAAAPAVPLNFPFLLIGGGLLVLAAVLLVSRSRKLRRRKEREDLRIDE